MKAELEVATFNSAEAKKLFSVMGVLSVCEGRRPRSDAVVAAARAVSLLASSLRAAPCRRLPAVFPPPLVILSDGACEPGVELPSVSIGACLFRNDGRAEFFDARVDDCVVRLWAGRADQQVDGQADFLLAA